MDKNVSSYSLLSGEPVPTSSIEKEMNLEVSHRMQSLLVMRHGDRQDDLDFSWVLTAQRPWDPPLSEGGKVRAWETGKRLCAQGRNITRVLCSPFLRCVQTALEVVTALTLVNYTTSQTSRRDAIVNPSKVKVSIEYGLAEVMNKMAIRVERLPPQGPTTLDLSELYALFPAGTVDLSVKPILPSLPKWQESLEDCHARYASTMQAAADMFPSENILLVTHAEGVCVSVMKHLQTHVYGVEYCGFSHAQRPIFDCTRGDFVLCEGDLSGILMSLSNNS